jgi:hypothetical protein
VQPFYLSSETVLPIERNRSTFQTQLVPLHGGGAEDGAEASKPEPVAAEAAAAAQPEDADADLLMGLV